MDSTRPFHHQALRVGRRISQERERERPATARPAKGINDAKKYRQKLRRLKNSREERESSFLGCASSEPRDDQGADLLFDLSILDPHPRPTLLSSGRSRVRSSLVVFVPSSLLAPPLFLFPSLSISHIHTRTDIHIISLPLHRRLLLFSSLACFAKSPHGRKRHVLL